MLHYFIQTQKKREKRTYNPHKHTAETYLNEGTDDAQGGEAQVLEGTGLTDGLQEGVQVQGDVGRQELRSGVRVGGDTLEKEGKC